MADPLPRTPVPQMIYSDTLDDATLKLLSKVWRNAAPIEIYDTAADEVMVRIVAADHDLQIIETIATNPDDDLVHQLLDIATWTGLTSLPTLLHARTKLTEGGVDIRSPQWGEPNKQRYYGISELITLNKLGRHAASMLASAYPAADWVTAIDDITEATGRDGREGEAARVAALGAASGLTPAQTVQRLKDALAAGVSRYDLDQVFGPDAPPLDLLGVHGIALVADALEMKQKGLERTDYFALLREGIPLSIINGFVTHGKITSPEQIKALYAEGAHPVFIQRARAEGLSVEQWAQVMKPLAPYVGERHGSWISGISSEPGVYRLQELSADGAALPLRVAWDKPSGDQPKALTPERRRHLAEHGVGPAEFEVVFRLLSRRTSAYRLEQVPVTEEHLDSVIAVVQAGGQDTCAILERLVTGPIDRRSKSRTPLRVTAQQLVQLVQLAPTEQEALYLGHVADDNARGWIGQLQLWRRFEPEAAEFTAMLRAMPEIEPFLVWLGRQPVTELFFGVNPVRTEAVRMLTGRVAGRKDPKGARPSYLHFVVLAGSLPQQAHGRVWTSEAVEGGKRLQHQIEQFMRGVSEVARREHLGQEPGELSMRAEIERGVKALPEKEV